MHIQTLPDGTTVGCSCDAGTDHGTAAEPEQALTDELAEPQDRFTGAAQQVEELID